MDIDRRKGRNRTRSPFTLICTVLFLLHLRVSPSLCSTLYFTNNSNIDRLENRKITPVIEAGSELTALDCNSCDDRIYWTNGREIKRSFPNASSSIELVLSQGITAPRGVAVDWRGNNVYFTDQIHNEQGSVEVVTCDGMYRRVLFRNDPIEYKEAGPIVVDALHGYIFFADIFCCIWRSNMDGSNVKKIIPTVSEEVLDLAIDYNNSILYWIDNGQIYSSSYDGTGQEQISGTVLNTSVPIGVSIDDGVLYWTQEKTKSSDGAIFSYDLGGNVAKADLVGSNSALNPHDISAFVSKDVIASVTGGCSNQNGQCDHFCFTLPNPDNPQSISSLVQCACRTGFPLNSDNRTCAAPLNFLLVGEGRYINLLSFDIPDEDIPLPLPITASGTVDYITYDRQNNLVYWTQRDPPAIWQATFNGDNQKTIVSESIALPQGIVISDEGTNLYWADSALDKIEVLSLHNEDADPFPRRTLIDTGLDHPIGLAINESIGFIYWTDTGLDPLVERAAKDGTARSKVYESSNFPGPITVNFETGDLYWSDSHEDKAGIYMYRNGQDVNELGINLAGQYVAGLSVLRERLYWTDRINGKLMRRSLTTLSGNTEVVADHLGGVRDVTSVDIEASPIKTGCSSDNGGCDDICVASAGGSGQQHTCLCRSHFMTDPDKNTACVEERAATLIISTNISVRIVPFSNPFGNSVLPISARRIDLDYTEQVLYWIGLKDGFIHRSDIISSSPNASDYVTMPIATCCYGYIADLAVDWWGRNLYWTDSETGKIWVSKLNGESRQVLVEGLEEPTHLVLDPYESKLYFVDNDINVKSVLMNGAGSVETLWKAPLIKPILDLTIDVADHILFWTFNQSLYEYRLRGQTPATPVWFHEDYKGGFFPGTREPSWLSYYEDEVYMFIHSNGIYKFNEISHDHRLHFLLKTYLPDIDTVTGIAVNHHSVQPDVHWCSKTNGECDPTGTPQPLCLVTEHYDRECRCAPTEFLDATYDSDRDVCRYHCIGSDAFLLLSTSSKVLYLPLRDNNLYNEQASIDSSCINLRLLPRELPLGEMGKIQAISFDPLSEKVFWIDKSSDTIESNFLNGTERHILGEYKSLSASSMAYDWRAGTVFWTETYGTQIDAVTHDGRASGTIFEYQYSPANVWEPVKIAVDSRDSVLYWSRSSDFSLNKISLHSTNSYESSRVTLNSTMKLQIGQMTIEPRNNILFWYNKYSRAIEGLDIAKDTLTTVYDSMADDNQNLITAMAASTLEGHVILLWYNQSDWTVRYYNKTANSVGVYRQLEEGTEILSMTAHDNGYDEINIKDNPCVSDTLSCSHFCSPPSPGFGVSTTCACPLHRTLLDDSKSCSELMCGSLLSCSDCSNCYPRSSKCDGIKNCEDASDETDCMCDLGETECIPGNTAVPCVPLNDLCQDNDNNAHCDQSMCNCSEAEFKCPDYSKCLPSSFLCDGQADCKSYDEMGCEVPTPQQSSSVTLTTASSNSPTAPSASAIGDAIVSVISIVGVMALLISIAICCFTVRYILTRKHKDIHHMRQESTSLKTSTSPQPSQSRSLYTSNLSINTMVTGSTNVDKTSQEARFINLKRLSTLSTDPSNPPNSPITHRSIAFTIGGCDTCTMYSEYDPPIPPVPNPSLNYDAISEGISSVSQRKYPAILPSNGISRHHESPPPPYYNNQLGGSYVGYEDEDSMDAYKDFCPPINPSALYHLNGVHSHLDDISETTFSMTTYNEITQNHNYSCNGYLPAEEPQLREREEQEGEVGDVGEHQEGHVIHPYDCPPPPSPVTEYSVHGD